MTQITVKVDANEVTTLASRAILAVERLPQKVIKREMEVIKEQIGEAYQYIPELPTYQRTGTYYRSFKIQSVGRGYTLVSDAQQKGRRYTRYVGGLADGSGQARIHRRRGWPLIKDLVQRAIERIVERGDEYFRAVMERNGAP